MPTVYRTETNARRYRFHATKECWQLAKTPKSGVRAQVQEVDLADLDRAIPCRTCYPDAPRVGSAHRYCRECNKGFAAPCPHNGGVPVHVVKTRRVHTMLTSPGDTYNARIYVWPERLHLYLN